MTCSARSAWAPSPRAPSGSCNATGEHARRRREGPSDTLTAQEAQIARLAAEGLSNPEIGARLFISPRTVEHHLRSVFAKLGLSARAELAQALTGRATM